MGGDLVLFKFEKSFNAEKVLRRGERFYKAKEVNL